MMKGPPGITLPPSTQSDCISPPGNLDSKTEINIGGQKFNCDADDLESLSTLGQGAYGVVEKMRHRPSGKIMAVKRITATINGEEEKRLLMDLDVSMKSGLCTYTVQSYGALFREGDVWILMEVMDASLDKFYKKVYTDTNIPEDVLTIIASSVVRALHYLHQNLHVIHRDVKPSNILVNRLGFVKICDFGISGYLVDSLANTRDAGCRPYMAPERINPSVSGKGYDIRSDVWSLGITMIELATGRFPYGCGNPFQQLREVVMGNPPTLPPGQFTKEFEDFIVKCLKKDFKERPYYGSLLEHPFIVRADTLEVDMAKYISSVLDKYSGWEG
ncbi:dual specificity mitogen-activated protein kinase kinase 6-like [Argonauta hians]